MRSNITTGTTAGLYFYELASSWQIVFILSWAVQSGSATREDIREGQANIVYYTQRS